MYQADLTEAQEVELERVRKEYEAGLKEAAEDSGMSEDVIFADIVVATCWDIKDKAVARELCRMELGYIPQELEHKLGKADWLRGV